MPTPGHIWQWQKYQPAHCRKSTHISLKSTYVIANQQLFLNLTLSKHAKTQTFAAWETTLDISRPQLCPNAPPDPWTWRATAAKRDFGLERCLPVREFCPSGKMDPKFYIKSSNIRQRKFRRSQTSDNMDRWKAEMGRVREEKRREEKKKEKVSEERRSRCAKR